MSLRLTCSQNDLLSICSQEPCPFLLLVLLLCALCQINEIIWRNWYTKHLSPRALTNVGLPFFGVTTVGFVTSVGCFFAVCSGFCFSSVIPPFTPPLLVASTFLLIWVPLVHAVLDRENICHSHHKLCRQRSSLQL